MIDQDVIAAFTTYAAQTTARPVRVVDTRELPCGVVEVTFLADFGYQQYGYLCQPCARRYGINHYYAIPAIAGYHFPQVDGGPMSDLHGPGTETLDTHRAAVEAMA